MDINEVDFYVTGFMLQTTSGPEPEIYIKRVVEGNRTRRKNLEGIAINVVELAKNVSNRITLQNRGYYRMSLKDQSLIRINSKGKVLGPT